MEESKKLFSQKAISIATFFGGPAAAGYLIKKNYDAFDQQEQGKTAFVIGLVITLLLIILFYTLPDSVSDKIPNAVLPAIYSAVVYWLVDKTQGARIEAHEAMGGEFYSRWKAAGIGAVFMVLLLVLIFGSLYLSGDLYGPGFDTTRYDKEASKFAENEEQALAVFGMMETTAPDVIVQELAKGTALWKENKEVLQRLASFEHLPDKLLRNNKKLMHYCDLRIAHGEYIIRALNENTDQYDADIERIGSEIEKILGELE